VAKLNMEINRFGAPTFEACAMKGEGVRETLTGVSKLVLKHLAEKYGGGVVEAPAPPPPVAPAPKAPPAPPPVAAAQVHTWPLEVEELSVGEMLEEIEELDMPLDGPSAPTPTHMPHNSVVEVPVVLDRSLFTGDHPIEIKLKLYLK
jgi:hypothetical protein